MHKTATAYVVSASMLAGHQEGIQILNDQYGDLFILSLSLSPDKPIIESFMDACELDYWFLSPYPRPDMEIEIDVANGGILVLQSFEQVVDLKQIYDDVVFISEDKDDIRTAHSNGIQTHHLLRCESNDQYSLAIFGR